MQLEEAKRYYVALLKEEILEARERSIRLRNLAEYLIGEKELMLRQAEVEDMSAEQYEHMLMSVKDWWGL